VNHSSSKQSSSKVAAIARRTGVSVRTLHYYEEIGLLCPSARTASGHRLYTHKEVEKLQQIRRLQHLGMGLSAIADCFEAGRIDGRQVVQDRLARLENELRDLEQLRSLLNNVSALLDESGHEGSSTTESFLQALETITMFDKYFTPDQQQRLQDHQASGTDIVSPVVADLQKAMDDGVAADSPRALTLVQRWGEALDEVTGGDEKMIESIHKMLHEEQEARAAHGISEPLFEYMGRVMASAEHT